MIDNSDIERILPYYFFDYRKALRTKNKAEKESSNDTEGNYKTINGKKYRVVSADKASWVKGIF